MNTLKSVSFKYVVLAVGGMIALTAFGEAGYNPTQTSADITKAAGILNPASQALQAGKSLDAKGFSASLKESVEKAEAKITTNKKELKWRKDNEKERAEVDQLKIVNSLPGIVKLNISKRRDEKNAQLKNSIAALNQTPQSAVNPGDFDTSGLSGQCRDGVDFTQFRSLADLMNSQPLKYAREQMQLYFQDKDKKAKDERLATVTAALKEAEKLADQDEEEKAQTSVLDAGLSDEARIDGLKQDNAKLKANKKTLKKQSVKALGDMFTSLTQIEENDGRVEQIAANTADSFEGFRKALFDSAMGQATRLRQNCLDEAKKLGKDSPFSPNTLLGKAYAKVTEYYKGDVNAASIGQQYATGIQNTVAGLKCTSITSQVDGALGANLQTLGSQFRATKDPNLLIQGAMTAFQTAASAPGQIGPSVKSLMNKCEKIAQNSEKVKKFIGATEQAIAQDAASQQGQQQPGQPTARLQGNRSRGGRGGAATHRTGASR